MGDAFARLSSTLESILAPRVFAALTLLVPVPALAVPLLSMEQRLPDENGLGGRVSVAIDGSTAVVGYKSDGPTGAAFIYERDLSGAWREVQRITPSDGGGTFGFQVAVSGDIAVASKEVIPFGVYLYGRDVGGPDNWGEIKKITADDPAGVSRYGHALAIDGDTLVVGAPGSGIPLVCPGSDCGAVFLYERHLGGADNWGERTRVDPTDPTPGDLYGKSVALDGDRLVSGSRSDDDGTTDGGAVYIHERDLGGADHWGQGGEIWASDPEADAFFGDAVGVHGDRVVVGATGKDPAGAAYVFERDEGGPANWGQVQKLTASDGEAGDAFGAYVDLEDDVVLVGARYDDHLLVTGSGYLFRRDVGGPANWGEARKLTHSGDGGAFLQGAQLDAGTAILGSTLGLTPGAFVFHSPVVRMFVTATAYPADFGGLAAADSICQAEAEAASLPGLWLSFLSVPGTDRFDRLPVGVRIDRIDYVDLAADAADLNGPIDAPLERDPTNAAVPSGTHVWTGDSDADGSCSGFTATTGDTGVHGITSETDVGWHLAGDDACTESNRLYCFRFVCPSTPAIGCSEGWGKASLLHSQIKTGREKLRVSLRAGPALGQTDFGAPLDVGGTAFTACVYDEYDQLAGQFQVNRAGDDCAGKPCWKSIGAAPPDGKGYAFKDKELSSDGIKQLRVLAGAAGKSKIIMKGDNNAGKGLTSLPSRVAEDLAGATSARIQIHGDDLAQCFGATLGDVKKSFVSFFQASN